MSHPDTVRVLMYSHDTYGLGHLTRTLRIAGAIRARYARASILILSGSPVAPYMPLPPGADLVKLPSVLKSGADTYRARDLDIDFKRVKAMRREVIRSTAEAFQPHLFLVDNVPLGMKSEILPTLEMLRFKHPETKIVLDLRDILDEPSVIRANWERDHVPSVLQSLYDHILVFGDPTVFDAQEAYDLPAEKTTFVGYLTPSSPLQQSEPARVSENGTPREARILLTAGGGGDGYEFLTSALEGLAHLAAGRNGAASAWAGDAAPVLHVEVVTGPLMEADDRRRLGELSQACGATIEEFVPDMQDRMAKADLVLAMAGYNTCCELLSHAKRALLLPRTQPRLEQLLRARALERRGLWTVLGPGSTNPSAIAQATAHAIRRGPRINIADLPAMNGLERMADQLGLLCPALLGGRPRPPRTARASAKAPASTKSQPPRAGGDEGLFARAASRLQARPLGLAAFRFWPGAVVHPAG